MKATVAVGTRVEVRVGMGVDVGAKSVEVGVNVGGTLVGAGVDVGAALVGVMDGGIGLAPAEVLNKSKRSVVEPALPRMGVIPKISSTVFKSEPWV